MYHLTLQQNMSPPLKQDLIDCIYNVVVYIHACMCYGGGEVGWGVGGRVNLISVKDI